MKSDVVKRVARAVLGRTLYRVGNVATIRFGPARGLRYRIFADYGIGPVFGRWEPDSRKSICRRLALEVPAPDQVEIESGTGYWGSKCLRMKSRLVSPVE